MQNASVQCRDESYQQDLFTSADFYSTAENNHNCNLRATAKDVEEQKMCNIAFCVRSRVVRREIELLPVCGIQDVS